MASSFITSLSDSEKDLVNQIVFFTQNNTSLVVVNLLPYLKFSKTASDNSSFYISRNASRQLIIKFRERIEESKKYIGELIQLNQKTILSVLEYIAEAYGKKSQQGNQEELDVKTITSQTKLNKFAKLNDQFDNILFTLIDLFKLFEKKIDDMNVRWHFELEEMPLFSIEKKYQLEKPMFIIDCLDPYQVQNQRTKYEISEDTQTNEIIEGMVNFLDKSKGEFNYKKNVLEQKDETDQEVLNEISSIDEKINKDIVSPRKIFVSNKFNKSLEKADKKTLAKVNEVLKDFENAPRGKENHAYMKRFQINRISRFIKMRISDVQRIVFQYFNYQGYSAVRVIDFIPDHKYEYLEELDENRLRYILWSDSTTEKVHLPFLNKQQQLIVFDPHYPSLIFGAAGSGKTSISIEKYLHLYREIKDQETTQFLSKEKLLYLTFHPKMAEDVTSQIRMYYTQVNAMTVDDFFINIIKDPTIKILNFESFSSWFQQKYTFAFDAQGRKTSTTIDTSNPASVAYTYYRGVFKGSIGDSLDVAVDQEHLDYNQFIKYMLTETSNKDLIDNLWEVFTEYELYIKKNGCYHDNDLARKVLKKMNQFEGKYENLIIDETQDLTFIQIYTILRLSQNYRVYFFGDSNQTINPTIFTLGKLNSVIYQMSDEQIKIEKKHILKKTYRSSKGLVEYTNHLVDLRRDWIAAQGEEVDYYHESFEEDIDTRWAARIHDPLIIEELILKTLNNPNAIVLVPTQLVKKKLLSQLGISEENQNRIYTISEAKGLEWDSVLLYHFIGSEFYKYKDMIEGKGEKSTIHRMIFNQYYVGCTRARKTTLILESFDHDGLKQRLFSPIHEISDVETLDLYFNNDVSVEAWLKEAHNLFSQYEYRKAKLSFEKAKTMNGKDVEDFIQLCDELALAHRQGDYQLSKDTQLMLKRKGYFKHLIHYYQSRNMKDYIQLMHFHQGQNFSKEEIMNMLLEIEIDTMDEQLIQESLFMKELNAKESEYKKNMKEVLK